MSMKLPPLETQRAIVSELEAERALVSANRELAERMEGRIAAAMGRLNLLLRSGASHRAVL